MDEDGALVFDAGPGTRLACEGLIREIGRRTFVLTHPHLDHFRDAPELLDSLEWDEVYMFDGVHSQDEVLRQALSKGARFAAHGATRAAYHTQFGKLFSVWCALGASSRFTAGRRTLIPFSKSLSVQVMAPQSASVEQFLAGLSQGDLFDCQKQKRQLGNRVSVVGLVRTGAGDILTLADADDDALLGIVDELGALEPPLNLRILKVSHHGSKRAGNSAEFVARLGRPAAGAVAALSPAERYDLPADQVIERWQAAGFRVQVSAAPHSLQRPATRYARRPSKPRIRHDRENCVLVAELLPDGEVRVRGGIDGGDYMQRVREISRSTGTTCSLF